MSSPPTSTRIACATPEFVERAEPLELEDWLSYFDPEIIVLTGTSSAPRAASELRRRIDGGLKLFHPAGNTSISGPVRIDGVQFVFVQTVETLREIPDFEKDELDGNYPTFVLSGLLELDIDTTALSTTLVGQEEYVSSLQTEALDGEYVHISTRLPADYRRDWDGLTVIGAGVDGGRGEMPLVGLDCRADGTILTRSVNRSQLGFRGLHRVGKKRANDLREAGFTNRAAIVEANPGALSDLPGIGPRTAEQIHQSAEAIVHDEIVRDSNDQLPTGDPVYIDIETDGLDPTTTWLIGVLDGPAANGDYTAFVQKDPEKPGRAIEKFMAWYTKSATPRPLVAYNGLQFDFSVIQDHIVEYCPHYEDEWTSTNRFDPYNWAVKKGNALLPGRTNKLEDVASALDYERSTTGLTGASVARTYQQWMDDQSAGTEPDWELYKAYCEDDVRGLATVYEALQESGRIVSSTETAPDHSETTTQGTLSDW